MGPLGWQETVFIFVLALLIFGPKKLPELGRTLGKAMTEFRRASNELKATFDREMKTLERENEDLKDVTSQYSPDSYNYDYSSYDDGSNYDYSSESSGSESESSSTATDTPTESASATQGAESQPAAPEGTIAQGTEVAAVTSGSGSEAAQQPAPPHEATTTEYKA